jgi:cell division protein FtsA
LGSKTKLAVGLDLASTSTRVVICSLDGQALRFLGYGEGPVQAWNKGRLSDRQALAESIRFALHEAELRAGASPESALIGMGGCVSGVNSRGIYEFGRRREIEAGDLRYAVELAARVRMEEDRQVLQICPQDFILDGRSGYRNPKGILGARLEANVHVVTASLQEHQALTSAVHLAHLAVEESVFEAIAAAYGAVLPEDRARGVALIDIGAHSTELAIYDGDALLMAASIPIGAEHFTRDISWLFKVNYDCAETLKREFGSAMAAAAPENSMVELPSGEGGNHREASRRELNEILEARAEQLFERVHAEVRRSGMEQSLLEGAVLTGGGALLAGMCDVAERVMHCQARKGLATGIDDWPAELDDPTWATAGGLAMYSARLKLRRDWKRGASSMAGTAAG